MIDYTLSKGQHASPEEGWCAMELVAYLAGEAHSDSPECADPALGRLVIGLNDHLPDDLRQQLLPYLDRMIGTAEDGRAQERLYMMLDWGFRVVAPEALEGRGDRRDWADELRALEPVVDTATMRAAERVARDAASCLVCCSTNPVSAVANAVTFAVMGNDVQAANNLSSAAANATLDDHVGVNKDAKRAMWLKLLPSALDLLDRLLEDEIVELPPEKAAEYDRLLATRR